MNLRDIKKVSALAVILFGACVTASAADKPNVIILLGDDIGYEAFGFTGDSYARTPNVDKLANEAVSFDRFYTTVSLCGPARAELWSGLYPHRNGILGNRTSVDLEGVTSMVDILEPLGYLVGQTGKFHYNKGKLFEKVSGFQPNCKRSVDNYKFDDVKAFIQKAQDQERPFLMAINSIHAHHPWDMGTPQENGAERVNVPDHYVDTPTTREILARHAAEVSLFDQQLGDIRVMMEEMNLTENTILICLSEQGIAMPRAKWSVNEKGNRSLCLIAWPGMIEPGRTQALGLYCDILATIADYAGDPAPAIDGRSLRPVLERKSDQHRKSVHLYCAEPHQRWALLEADGTKLIWNPDPNARYISPNFFETPSKDGTYRKHYSKAWAEWEALALTDPSAAEKIKHIIHPDELELYHIDQDYNEINNLANNPENEARLNRMFVELKALSAPVRELMDAGGKHAKKRNAQDEND